MGHADDRRFANTRNSIQHFLDLFGINVEPAGDDDILGAADDGDAPVLADRRDIAGDEIPIRREVLPGLFRHPPIAVEDIWPLDFENAGLRSGDPDRDARKGKADGSGHPLALIGIGSDHAGLGHAVALKNGVAGSVAEIGMGFGEQRRGTGNEQPHEARCIGGEARLGQKPCIESRHPHHQRCPRHRRNRR